MMVWQNTNHIWVSLFTRLLNIKNPKICEVYDYNDVTFSGQIWFTNSCDSLNSVHAIFYEILDQFWIPNFKTITGYTQVKVLN